LIKSMKKQLDDAAQDKLVLQVELDDTKKKNAAANKAAQTAEFDLQTRIDAFEVQVEQQKIESTQKTAESTSKCEADLRQLRDKYSGVEMLERKVEQRTSLIKELNTEISSLKAQAAVSGSKAAADALIVQSLEDQITVVAQENAAAIDVAATDAVKTLEASRRVGELQLKTTVGKVAILAKKLETAESLLEAAKASVVALEGEVGLLRNATTSLTEQISAAEIRTSSILRELDDSLEIQMRSDDACTRANDELLAKDAALGSANDKIICLEASLTEIGASKDSLEEEFKHLRNSVSSRSSNISIESPSATSKEASSPLEPVQEPKRKRINPLAEQSGEGNEGLLSPARNAESHVETLTDLQTKVAFMANSAEAVAVSAAVTALSEARAISELETAKRSQILLEKKRLALEKNAIAAQANKIQLEVTEVNLSLLKKSMVALQKEHNLVLESVSNKDAMLANALIKLEELDQRPKPVPPACVALVSPLIHEAKVPEVQESHPICQLAVLVAVFACPLVFIALFFSLIIFCGGVEVPLAQTKFTSVS